jgi:hypothetical protein
LGGSYKSYVTGALTSGCNDMDGGYTELLSPVFDAQGAETLMLGITTFLSNNTGANPGEDPLTIQVSNVRGRPKRGSVAVAGHAEVLVPDAVARVREAVRAKYRIMYRVLIERSDKKAAKESGSATAETAAIKVVLDV